MTTIKSITVDPRPLDFDTMSTQQDSSQRNESEEARYDQDRFQDHFIAIVRLTKDVRSHITFLAALYFVGGAAEAAFLVAVARIGLAVADGQSNVEVTSSLNISIYSCLMVTVGLLILRLISSLFGVRISMGITYRVSVALRMRLSHSFLRTSWAIQQIQPAGIMQQLVVTFPNQGAGLIIQLATSMGAAITLASMLATSVIVDATATLVVVLVLIALALVLRPLSGRLRNHSRNSIDPQISFSNGVAQVGTLGLEIQSFGVQREAEKILDDLIKTDASAQRRVGLISYSIGHVYSSLAYFTIISALVVITSLGVERLQSSGAVMLVMMRTLSYGQLLQQSSAHLAQIFPFLNKIDETVNIFELNEATSGTDAILNVGPIDFKDVNFSYVSDRPVLRDISFELMSGCSYGVIGPSGSGKSTLVQLLLGIREPSSGIITANGVNLKNIDRKSWTSKVAFVPQDATLITGTVAENIAFYRSDITEKQMVAAARSANVLDDIEKLPLGFQTNLGERGQQLSGGQRQRLSIARALVGNPELLILDEPTSALDMKSESVIRDTIALLNGKVTVVVIAHRLSTLDVCSKIMVIQDGNLKAFATPKELASNNDFYKEAINLAHMV
jgi:ATP-binding cassette subfamily B protein